jgi:hypothetical protein
VNINVSLQWRCTQSLYADVNADVEVQEARRQAVGFVLRGPAALLYVSSFISSVKFQGMMRTYRYMHVPDLIWI